MEGGGEQERWEVGNGKDGERLGTGRLEGG